METDGNRTFGLSTDSQGGTITKRSFDTRLLLIQDKPRFEPGLLSMESTHSLLPNTSAIKSLPRGIRGVRSERLMKTIQQLDTFPKTTQFVPAFKKEDIDMLNIKILQGRG